MTSSRKVDRRRFLAGTVAATAAVVTGPYIRTSHAAGKLEVGFWDHWVPGANDVLTKMCQEWAAKEKVELKIDYIPSQGNKNLLTIAAEAQAKAGHDMLAFPTWWPADKANELEPVDDVMKTLIAANGAGVAADRVPRASTTATGWRFRPRRAARSRGPAARIDLFKQHAGIDLQKMYPAARRPTRRCPTPGPGTRCWRPREVPQGGLPVRHRPGPDHRLGRLDGRAVRRLRRRAGGRQGQHHGQVRRGEAGARVHEEAGAVPAAATCSPGTTPRTTSGWSPARAR